MHELLSLSDYGELIYSYKAIIHNETGCYDYFSYTNNEKNKRLELFVVIDQEDGSYIYKLIGPHNDIIITSNINNYIDLLLQQNKSVNIFNYNNSEKRNESTFTVTFTHNDNSIEISFDKSYTVVQNIESNSVTVYDQFENFSDANIVETYMFTDNGFYRIEKLNLSKRISYLSKDTLIDYYDFQDSKNKFDNIILDTLPQLAYCYIEEEKSDTFYISYDDLGVPYYVVKNYGERRLSQYECNLNKKENFFSRAVYPNIFDNLDFNYVDNSLEIWSEIEVELVGEHTIIRKNTFRVHKDNLDPLLNQLSESLAPFIKISE